MNDLTRQANNNLNFFSFIFLILFTSLILFDLTVYKFIWGIESIARAANLFVLAFFAIFSSISILYMKLSIRIWSFIVLPSLLIFLSTFVNISRYAFQDASIVSFYGALLPIVALMAAPFLVKIGVLKTSKIFFYYYLAMLFIVSISLIEYILVFTGYVTPSLIQTSGGDFVATNFSILFDLEDNIYNENDFSINFYASIIESGSLAMLILPAMIYALFMKYYKGLIILLIGLLATNSLGGFISLALFAIIYPYVDSRFLNHNKSTSKSLFYFFYILLLLCISFFVADYLIDYYNQKFLVVGIGYNDAATSGSTRINNITMLFGNLPSILIENPLGYPLSSSSDEIFKDNFYGFNVGLGIAIYNGGFLSFVGYVILTLTFIFTSIKALLKKNLKKEEVIAASSILILIPFFIQRGAIFETSILVLMTAPFVIEYLNNKDNNAHDLNKGNL